MKKTLILLSLALSAFILMCGCSSQSEKVSIYVTNTEDNNTVVSYDNGETWSGDVPGAYMVISSANVKDSIRGISVTIVNKSYLYPVEVSTGDLFRLYRKENDEWVLCDEVLPDNGVEHSFSDVGETIPDGESLRFSCDLSYYKLSSGKYKIVKYITVDEWNEDTRLWFKDFEVGAEFNVE